MSTATDWDTFRAAIDQYHTGGIHWLFADDQANIGYTGYTLLPVREQLDPNHPPVTWLPGSEGYEWVEDPEGPLGFATVPREDVPWSFNPERGWIVTANNDPGAVMEDNDPLNDPVYIAGMYDLGARAYQASRRIEEALSGRPDFDDAIDIQLDSSSRPAERLLPFLFQAATRRPDLVTAPAQQALDILAAWDYRCGVDAVAPTLFHGFMIVFLREMFDDVEGGILGELLLGDTPPAVGQFLLKTAIHFLEETDAHIDAIDAGEMAFPSASGADFFDDDRSEVRETRDQLLLVSLAKALDELSPMLANLGADGDDMTTWTWGTAHTVRLDDPAAVVVPEASSERYPMNGSLYTFQAGDFDLLHDGQLPERFDAANISSNRFVFEMIPGAIRAAAILPGGQSEQPDSPHHNDQLAEFVDGTYRTLRYYPDEVAEGLEETWSVPADYPRSGGISVD
jgi:penicillin amidase